MEQGGIGFKDDVVASGVACDGYFLPVKICNCVAGPAVGEGNGAEVPIVVVLLVAPVFDVDAGSGIDVVSHRHRGAPGRVGWAVGGGRRLRGSRGGNRVGQCGGVLRCDCYRQCVGPDGEVEFGFAWRGVVVVAGDDHCGIGVVLGRAQLYGVYPVCDCCRVGGGSRGKIRAERNSLAAGSLEFEVAQRGVTGEGGGVGVNVDRSTDLDSVRLYRLMWVPSLGCLFCQHCRCPSRKVRAVLSIGGCDTYLVLRVAGRRCRVAVFHHDEVAGVRFESRFGGGGERVNPEICKGPRVVQGVEDCTGVGAGS